MGIGSGMNIANETGVKYGENLSHNLSALIETADYPDYDTLTEEQKNLWGSKTNYDAAKFNSLMTAFNLGGSRDGYYASDGGNFEFSDDASERLQQLGRIGQNWINRAGNAFGVVRGMLTSRSDVVQGYLGRVENFTYDSAAVADEWPEGIPSNVIITSGSRFGWASKRAASSTKYDVFMRGSTSAVYYVMWIYGTGNYPTQIQYMFSRDPFVYGSRTVYNVTQDQVNDYDVTNYSSNAGLRESQYGNYYRASSNGNNLMIDPVIFSSLLMISVVILMIPPWIIPKQLI